jgi:hypothetical protein
VDVETESDANERVIFEIQMGRDAQIMRRDLFSASHIFNETSRKGDTSAQMAARMPKVIYINILGHNIRNDNKELVQPFKVLYTKAPQRVAVPNFSGYNVQLPRVAEMAQNFGDSLYCWCYALYTAHFKNKTVEEVVSMAPELQTFAARDAGFQQFCEQYSLVSASEEARYEYMLWVNDMMREEGMLEAAHISPEEAKNITFKRGVGCMGCDLKGYKGRRAVHEILVFDNKFRNMVHANKSVEEMRNYAIENGMQSLKEAAMKLLKDGITTIDELIEIVHGL